MLNAVRTPIKTGNDEEKKSETGRGYCKEVPEPIYCAEYKVNA
jgi:hypothetical protein